MPPTRAAPAAGVASVVFDLLHRRLEEEHQVDARDGEDDEAVETDLPQQQGPVVGENLAQGGPAEPFPADARIGPAGQPFVGERSPRCGILVCPAHMSLDHPCRRCRGLLPRHRSSAFAARRRRAARRPSRPERAHARTGRRAGRATPLSATARTRRGRARTRAGPRPRSRPRGRTPRGAGGARPRRRSPVSRRTGAYGPG